MNLKIKFICDSWHRKPENFFNLIIDNKLEIKEKLIFPDHYQFSKKILKIS